MTYPAPRYVIYDPNGTVPVGVIPAPLNVKFDVDYEKSSTLTFSLPSTMRTLLKTPREIVVQVPKSDGTYVDHATYLYLNEDDDLVSPDSNVTFTCPDMWWRLAGAIVRQEASPAWVGDSPRADYRYKRRFDNHSALQIMTALIEEEKTQGRLVGITVTGVANMITDFVEFEVGTPLDQVLSDLIGRKMCLAKWVGRQLNIIPTNPGTNKSATMNIVAGRDLIEAPFKQTWEKQADRVYVMGDNNLDAMVLSGGSPSPWGPRVASINAGGANTLARLREFGNRHLGTIAQVQKEQTARVALDNATHYPITDYTIGDTIGVWSRNPSDNHRKAVYRQERVTQIQIESNDKGQYVANLVLGNKILDGVLSKMAGTKSPVPQAPASYPTQGPLDTASPGWNPDWDDKFADLHCSPSCDCRAPRYPMLMGKDGMGPGDYAESGVYGYRVLAWVDHAGINGHRYRATFDSLGIRYIHPSHDPTAEMTLTKVGASVVIAQGIISPGEENNIDAWLASAAPEPARVLDRGYEWLIHDEVGVVRDHPGGFVSYLGQYSAGGTGAAHPHRTAIMLRSTYDHSNHGGRYVFSPQYVGAPLLVVEDLGPDS